MHGGRELAPFKLLCQRPVHRFPRVQPISAKRAAVRSCHGRSGAHTRAPRGYGACQQHMHPSLMLHLWIPPNPVRPASTSARRARARSSAHLRGERVHLLLSPLLLSLSPPVEPPRFRLEKRARGSPRSWRDAPRDAPHEAGHRGPRRRRDAHVRLYERAPRCRGQRPGMISVGASREGARALVGRTVWLYPPHHLRKNAIALDVQAVHRTGCLRQLFF